MYSFDIKVLKSMIQRDDKKSGQLSPFDHSPVHCSSLVKNFIFYKNYLLYLLEGVSVKVICSSVGLYKLVSNCVLPV